MVNCKIENAGSGIALIRGKTRHTNERVQSKTGKARKMRVSRPHDNKKIKKKFAKIPLYPLALQKQIAYNSNVVCSGMKR